MPTNASFRSTLEQLAAQVTLGQLNPITSSNRVAVSFTPAITVTPISQDVLAGGYFVKYSFGLESQLQGPPQGIQIPVGALGLATTIAPSGQTVSPVIPSYYFPHITFGCTSSQTGNVSFQRFIDLSGAIVQGAALTVALTANTAAVLDNADGKGFGSFQITITNTGVANAILSSVILLLLAR